MDETVAIIGATEDHTKYAYKALKILQAHGHRPIPVNPNLDVVVGLKAYPSLRDIPEQVDTVTLYVRPEVSSKLIDDILAVNPRRVIMNPGTENEELASAAAKAGIQVLRACTLVLLSTGQF
jgi:predicted CoA-binding protein